MILCLLCKLFFLVCSGAINAIKCIICNCYGLCDFRISIGSCRQFLTSDISLISDIIASNSTAMHSNYGACIRSTMFALWMLATVTRRQRRMMEVCLMKFQISSSYLNVCGALSGAFNILPTMKPAPLISKQQTSGLTPTTILLFTVHAKPKSCCFVAPIKTQPYNMDVLCNRY